MADMQIRRREARRRHMTSSVARKCRWPRTARSRRPASGRPGSQRICSIASAPAISCVA